MRSAPDSSLSFDDRLARFVGLGVDAVSLGGVLSDAFLRALERDPFLAVEYAQLVLARPRDAEEEARIRREVESAMDYALAVAERAGNGRCADISLFLMALLEARGVPSFGVNGSCIVSDEEGDLTGFNFLDSLDEPGATLTGHMWVVAPPFSVLDATIAYQDPIPLTRPHQPPPHVVSEEYIPEYQVRQNDMVAPRSRGQLSADLPSFQALADQIGVGIWRYDSASIRFIPGRVTLYEVALTDLQDHLRLGMTPAEAVQRFGESGVRASY
jgi:hypothetical protein